MICHVCHGSGSLLITKPALEWWGCPACFGAGVTYQHGPAYVNSKWRWRRRG